MSALTTEVSDLKTDRLKLWQKKNKTLEDVAEYTTQIQEWIQTQVYLPKKLTKNAIEFYLLNFNFNIEEIQKAINTYFYLRPVLPQIFDQNPTTESWAKEEDGCTIAPLPKLTAKNQKVLFLRVDDGNVNKLDVSRAIARFIIHPFEVELNKDFYEDHIFILDYQYFQKELIEKVTAIRIKICGLLYDNFYGESVKEVHFINVPEFAEPIIKNCRKYLFKKLGGTVYAHSTVEGLYEFIPKKILPAEYGGNEKSLVELQSDWQSKLNELKPVFDNLEKLDKKIEEEPVNPQAVAVKKAFETFMNIDEN